MSDKWVVMEICKSCGAKFAPGTAGDRKTDCPMC